MAEENASYAGKSLDDRLETMQQQLLGYRKKFLEDRFRGLLEPKLTEKEQEMLKNMSPEALDRSLKYMKKFYTDDISGIEGIMVEMVTKPGEYPLRGNIEKRIVELRERGVRIEDIPGCLRLAKQYTHGSLPVVARRFDLGCTVEEIEALFQFSQFLQDEYGVKTFVNTTYKHPSATREEDNVDLEADPKKKITKEKSLTNGQFLHKEYGIGRPYRPAGEVASSTHKNLVRLHKFLGDPIDVPGLTCSVDSLMEAFSRTRNLAWREKPLYAKIWIATELAERHDIRELEHLCDYIATGNILGDFEFPED